jgi:error-prone DNA polymerase
MSFVELACVSNFSFLRGASHTDELVWRAKALEYAGLGIADRNTLAGVVRAHKAAKEAGLRFLPGARLVTYEELEAVVYPRDRAAYGRLCRLLTLGNRRARKSQCLIRVADVLEAAQDWLVIVMAPDEAAHEWRSLAGPFATGLHPSNCVRLALSARFDGADARRFAELERLAASWGALSVAVGDVLYHTPERRALADVLSCIREKTTIDQAGWLIAPHGERFMHSPDQIAHLFRGHEAALARARAAVDFCTFSLDQLAYEYPDEVFGPTGEPPIETLRRLTEAGARARYPSGIPDKVRTQIDHEYRLISELKYEPYFLTVHDIVRFARSQGILCQGRGSAANSAVCYCLGVTAVDPDRIDLLFERFVSPERKEPPDIDVDFEHERREEVIQYIYEKYGRHRAGIAATVISYRAKSAIRDVGKAMGLSLDVTEALSGVVWGWSQGGITPDLVREHTGLDPDEPRLRRTLELARELMGFPRHLSQHVGGFVITRGPLEDIAPIGNAAMADRTFIEWDKDDLDTLGILKIDILALGMLSAIAKSLALLNQVKGLALDLAEVPAEDPSVYDMICDADTMGVFQIESRAQMSMLPRLKPRKFYDLVIEVAIVRPGPIQGDMVHPYLRRRQGLEPVSFPSRALEDVLGKTLGVPLFQEQAMKIAIVAAGFTPSEADKLRRAMATFRKTGVIHQFGMRMIEGMQANGYDRAFAERCFKQIEGFGEYGFPESHAASFALLVYVSAWIKKHHPDVFLAALLNSQPMGFYAPAQLVRDARAHGVTVRPPDVNDASVDCTLEPAASGEALSPVRLGLRMIKGLSPAAAERIKQARAADGAFPSLGDLARRAHLGDGELETLARADALRSLGLDRRDGLWAARGVKEAARAPLVAGAPEDAVEAPAQLPLMAPSEHVVRDYQTLRLSLKGHPVAFFRPELTQRRVVAANDLAATPKVRGVEVAGLVLVRQRPGSANGVIFMTIEDETGSANLIVWPTMFERWRKIVLNGQFIIARGKLQRQDGVIHLVAEHFEDWTGRLGELAEGNAPFQSPLARADEVKRPGHEPAPTPPADARRSQTDRRASRRLPAARDFR